MASINSSNTTNNIYGALGLKNKGIGGLASGLDTDTLVTALVSGTTSKIAKQGQQKQILNWKMTAYRSAATQLRAFQSKHFDYTSKTNTNMLSSGFWNTFKATSSSSKVSATATSNATIGNITIDKVQQVATAETLTSRTDTKLSTELTLGLTDDQSMTAGSFTGKTLKLDVNGSVKTVKLDDLNEFIIGGKLKFEYEGTDEEGNPVTHKLTDKLQELLDRAFGTKNVYDEGVTAPRIKHNVEVTLSGGKIKLDSDTSKIIVANRDAEVSWLGVKEGSSNRVDLKTKIGDIDAFRNLQGDVFTFSINGTEISVNRNDTLSDLMSKIKTSDAGVDLTYSAYTDQFTLTAKSEGAGENIVVEDVYGNLMNTLFGAKSAGGVGTNYLTTAGAALSQGVASFADIDWNNKAGVKALGSSLKYMAFEMTVDGVTKTVKVDTSVINSSDLYNGTFTQADVYNAINKGIKNAFTGTSVQLNGEYDLYDIDGNRVDVSTLNENGYFTYGENRFFDATGAEVDANGNPISLFNNQKFVYNRDDNFWYLGNVADGKKLSYTPGDDEEGTEGYWSYEDPADSNAVDGKVRVDFDNTEAEAQYLATSQWTGKTAIYGNGSAVTIEGGGILPLLGFAAGDGNVADGETRLSALAKSQASNSTGTQTSPALTGGTLTINGITDPDKQITYTAGMTINQLVAEINSKLGDQVKAELSEDGKLSINGLNGNIEISDSGNLLEKLFGVTNKVGDNLYYKTTDQDDYGNRHKAGENLEVVIDGQVHSYASNTFTLNGVNITVSDESDEKITVGVVSDVDDVVTRIKDWMDDYNALVYSLNSMINENKDSDYFPLTDEQKADMTEDQITKWETEAKKGVLRNDNTLKSILSELRQSLYEKVESAGISLYDIGITTKAYGYTDPNEAGQLEFTSKDFSKSGLSGEDKLRAMLTSDPDKVRLLFTDSTNGLAVKMNDIVDRAAKISSTNRGSLVRLAGTEQLTGDNTSVLKDKISAIDKYIAALKTRLESEYTRQWKKFSALELAVQKMSTQSSWFTSN